MFSVIKMIKKGIVAFLVFLFSELVKIVIQAFPSFSRMTIEELFVILISRISPALPTLTFGAMLMMLINFIKQKIK